MPMKAYSQDYIADLLKDSTLSVIGKYNGIQKQLKVSCSKCGSIFSSRADYILSKKRCLKCKKLNKIKHLGDGSIEVDVSTDTHKNAKMIIDFKDWVMIKRAGYGRVSAVVKGKYKSLYAQSHKNKKVILIHKLVFPEIPIIDHVNGNGLDNRKCNLRSCTQSQNAYNCKVRSHSKSGIKGVYMDARTNRFYSRIVCDGKSIHLGTFDTAKEAGDAFVDAAKKLHGKFAYSNKGE